MNGLRQFRVTQAMAVRIVADALMINAALVVALWARFVYTVVVRGHETRFDYERDLLSYVTAFVHNGWLLTIISLVVFAIWGFYTYGRAYQGRYKAIVIVQAVAEAYVIFGFITYFLWERLHLTEVPRGELK